MIKKNRIDHLYTAVYNVFSMLMVRKDADMATSPGTRNHISQHLTNLVAITDGRSDANHL